MSRVFDMMSLMLIPVGFLVGLVVLLILELVGLGFWSTAAILAGTCLLFIAYEYVSNRLSFNVFHMFLATKAERDMHSEIDARDRKIGTIAFTLGVVLAFMAAQVWSPLEISKALF